jgi:hypothetical protein
MRWRVMRAVGDQLEKARNDIHELPQLRKAVESLTERRALLDGVQFHEKRVASRHVDDNVVERDTPH